jgi:NAD(P)-dependent dehydrogenase (short-subunit alcohol dehydrogenase family)
MVAELRVTNIERARKNRYRDRLITRHVSIHERVLGIQDSPLISFSGKAIALRLAQDGYNICVNDIQANQSGAEEVVKQIQGMGRNAFPYAADVSNLQEVQQMVQASVKELGPLSTMVANAGIAQVKALLDLTEQDLKRMFEVNGTTYALNTELRLGANECSLRRIQLLLNRRKANDLARLRR